MSISRKLFSAGVVMALGAVAFAKGGAITVRKSKRETVREQWLRLLSGSEQMDYVRANNKVIAQNNLPQRTTSRAAELIGRANYQLYHA